MKRNVVTCDHCQRELTRAEVEVGMWVVRVPEIETRQIRSERVPDELHFCSRAHLAAWVVPPFPGASAG